MSLKVHAIAVGCNYTSPLQLKRTGNKVLLQGSDLEDAIAVAITAMNEPKTCSITTLRRYLLDSEKDRTENFLGERPSADLLVTHTAPRAACPPSPRNHWMFLEFLHLVPCFRRNVKRSSLVVISLYLETGHVRFSAGSWVILQI